MKLRPFGSVEDLELKLGLKKKKTGITGLSPRIFEDCVEVYKGYGAVDEIIGECERIGQDLAREISAWVGGNDGKNKSKGKSPSLDIEVAQDGSLSLHHLPVSGSSKSESKGLLTKSPSLLAEGVQLKDYQLMGGCWLNLLKRKNLSCILADEMGKCAFGMCKCLRVEECSCAGLGKTVQVISFIAHLKASGNRGPHLIVVPYVFLLSQDS